MDNFVDNFVSPFVDNILDNFSHNFRDNLGENLIPKVAVRQSSVNCKGTISRQTVVRHYVKLS